MTRPSGSSPSVLLVALLVGAVVLAPSAATSAAAEVDDQQSTTKMTPGAAPVHRRCAGRGSASPQEQRVRRWGRPSWLQLVDDHRRCDDPVPAPDAPRHESSGSDPDAEPEPGDGDDPDADPPDAGNGEEPRSPDVGADLPPPEAPEAPEAPGAPEEPEAPGASGAPEEPEAPEAPGEPVTPEAPDGHDRPRRDALVPPGSEDDGTVLPPSPLVPGDPAAGTVPDGRSGADEVALGPSAPIIGLPDGGPVDRGVPGSSAATTQDDVVRSAAGRVMASTGGDPGNGLQAALASARHPGARPVAGVVLVAVLLVTAGAFGRRRPGEAVTARPSGRRRRFDAEEPPP